MNMMVYIPDDIFIDRKNKKKVTDILGSVPDTCMRFPDTKTLGDAIDEIRELGEHKVAEFLLG